MGHDAESVLQMPGPERYRLLVEYVATTKELWIAESDNYVLTLRSPEESELLPVWPAPWFVEASFTTQDTEDGYVPVLRSLDEWFEKTTPALLREKVLVGSFPNTHMECPTIKAGKFRDDLLNAILVMKIQSADIRKIITRKPAG